MKLDSVDRNSTISDVPKDNNVKDQREILRHSIKEINTKDLTEPQKKNLPISEKVVIEAIEKANKAIEGARTEFRFSIHEKTHEISVKVLDKDNGEVIREIPPEKVLDLVAKMWEMAGIIVDERR